MPRETQGTIEKRYVPDLGRQVETLRRLITPAAVREVEAEHKRRQPKTKWLGDRAGTMESPICRWHTPDHYYERSPECGGGLVCGICHPAPGSEGASDGTS